MSLRSIPFLDAEGYVCSFFRNSGDFSIEAAFYSRTSGDILHVSSTDPAINRETCNIKSWLQVPPTSHDSYA